MDLNSCYSEALEDRSSDEEEEWHEVATGGEATTGESTRGEATGRDVNSEM